MANNKPPKAEETKPFTNDGAPPLPPIDPEQAAAFAGAPIDAQGDSGLSGETASPLDMPSGVKFHHAKCWNFYLHPGVGYPGEISVQFIGSVYVAANLAEELALRKIAETDKGLQVVA